MQDHAKTLRASNSVIASWHFCFGRGSVPGFDAWKELCQGWRTRSWTWAVQARTEFSVSVSILSIELYQYTCRTWCSNDWSDHHAWFKDCVRHIAWYLPLSRCNFSCVPISAILSFFITKMTFACRIVLSRCVTTIVVRLNVASFSAFCTMRSLWVFSAEVASSSNNKRDFWISALATAMRCLCSPEIEDSSSRKTYSDLQTTKTQSSKRWSDDKLLALSLQKARTSDQLRCSREQSQDTKTILAALRTCSDDMHVKTWARCHLHSMWCNQTLNRRSISEARWLCFCRNQRIWRSQCAFQIRSSLKFLATLS